LFLLCPVALAVTRVAVAAMRMRSKLDACLQDKQQQQWQQQVLDANWQGLSM
jgi:hypothetical protein